MTHGSLFSGIGGFDLAAEWMEWENLFHCEWNPFGRKVLHHYWPNAEQFTDITKSDFTKYANRIDVLTGGFPCQPYSVAGKRLGKDDERHLWPEMLRAIREIQPKYVVGENVAGLVNWNGGLVFDEVQADLEAAGYEVIPFVLPAAGVGAPHRRDRVWFVAYAESAGGRILRNESGTERTHTANELFRKRSGILLQSGPIADTSSSRWKNGLHGGSENGKRQTGELRNPTKEQFTQWQNFPAQSPLCSGDDGLSTKLDGITFSKWRNESIKAYGNAIVPQIAFQIFKTIQEFENQLT